GRCHFCHPVPLIPGNKKGANLAPFFTGWLDFPASANRHCGSGQKRTPVPFDAPLYDAPANAHPPRCGTCRTNGSCVETGTALRTDERPGSWGPVAAGCPPYGVARRNEFARAGGNPVSLTG